MKKLLSYSWLTASESGFVYIQAADPAVPFETELEAKDESSETTAADLTSDIAQDVTEYHGPVIYRNRAVDMVLFPGRLRHNKWHRRHVPLLYSGLSWK